MTFDGFEEGNPASAMSKSVLMASPQQRGTVPLMKLLHVLCLRKACLRSPQMCGGFGGVYGFDRFFQLSQPTQIAHAASLLTIYSKHTPKHQAVRRADKSCPNLKRSIDKSSNQQRECVPGSSSSEPAPSQLTGTPSLSSVMASSSL